MLKDHFKMFKAIMFDVDGTLTKLGTRYVPEDLEAQLRKVIESGIPVAVCSGRHHPDAILNRLGNMYPEKWTLFAENGACGYKFDGGSWQEFYRVAWPSDVVDKDELAERILACMPCSNSFNNPSSFIFRPGETLDISLPELERLCGEYVLKTEEIFKELGVTGIRINNSQIGIILNPEDGDKDRGTKEFAKLLGIENDKEIACIGDQPCEGCNDEKFLNGERGTPFVVNGPKDTLKVLAEMI
jgi:hydroxymethylpyrimidine pyrophosphatase-like HAD family hydrolase